MIVDNMPDVCKNCVERALCLSKGEGEHCCDECDYMIERFSLPLISKRGISIMLDPDTYDQIARLAAEHDLSTMQFVTQLLINAIKGEH